MGIESWSTTAASNNASPPNGAPEGMAPSAVNNVIRENMAAERSWYENAEWINLGYTCTQASGTTFTISGDKTADFTANRSIRIADSSTLYGYVVSSSYGAPNTTVTVQLLSGSLSSSMNGTTVSLSSIRPVTSTVLPGIPKNIFYGLHLYAADAGASDTYAITLTPSPISYETGMVIRFKANTANTGAATINVNSLGAKTIKKNYNSDLSDNDIVANQIVEVIYDGTNFQILSPVPDTVTNNCGFRATRTTSQSIDASSATKVQFATETFDTNSTYDNATNYRHTPSTAGKYFYCAKVLMDAFAGSSKTLELYLYKNGSLHDASTIKQIAAGNPSTVEVAGLIDMNGSSDYVEVFIFHNDTGAVNINGTGTYTNFSGIRIGA